MPHKMQDIRMACMDDTLAAFYDIQLELVNLFARMVETIR